jgi:hypothetical protein
MTVGPLGPHLRDHPIDVPGFRATNRDLNSWIKAVPDAPLTFQTTGQAKEVKLIPFYKTFDRRYSIYWTIA